MQTVSLDTLEKSQLPHSQARAILQAMELEITAHQTGIVMRDELKEAFQSVEHKIESVRSDLELKIESLRTDLELKIESVRNDLEFKIESVRNALELKIESVRRDLELKVESVRNDLELRIESVRSELSIKIEREVGNLGGQLTRFFVTCLLAQTAIMAGALYFSLAHFRP
jgi:hypothetical protein